MPEALLAIDCGTQSLRALLFSSTGDLLERERIEYEPYRSPKPGWAEQDPELFWKCLCEACRAIQARDPERFRRIAGVGITAQRNTMINVDEEGVPLRPAITWMDQRKARKVYFPGWPMHLAYWAVGMRSAIDKSQADGKCNWIRQCQPDIWENTYKYLQVSGFLNHRLTNRFVDSVASQIGHVPFNYQKMRWAEPGELTHNLFPVEKNKLPETVKPGQIIGAVTQTASLATGISEGTPVIACGSDKGCETIGMGVIDESMASLSFGTTATVQTTTNRYFEALRFMPAYPAPIPDHYNPEVEIFRGYWMISWFRNEFAYKEVLEAREKGILPEQVLDRHLASTPAGSMGLLVQPYWGPGLKNPRAKGAMIGFGDVHTKAHVYRAIIEGLGFALLEGLHRIEKVGKFRVKRVAVSGGASQSSEICQITADIFNLPLVGGRTSETSGLGASIISAVGLGIHPSYEAAIREMVGYENLFQPDPKNVVLYKKLYERVYGKIFRSLRPLYRDIRDITGYPSLDS